MSTGESVRDWTPPWPLDLQRTLSPLRRGSSDPTCRVQPAAGAVWRACHTPAGPGTIRITRSGSGVLAGAWGPGAGWLLDGLPELLGAADRPEEFTAVHPLLVAAVRQLPGLRLTRTGLIFDQVVPAILEQKVTGAQAHRSWRELVTRFGSPAPGPAEAPALRLPPEPADLLAVPDWDWHRAGVDLTRRRAIRAAATVAQRLDECSAMSVADAVHRLRTVPGVGAWTAAEVVQRALGAADEVSVGDYHLPSWVGRALTGRPLDDEGMLAVLEPYAPHRQRVVRLIELTYRPPRFGPRLAAVDYRRM